MTIRPTWADHDRRDVPQARPGGGGDDPEGPGPAAPKPPGPQGRGFRARLAAARARRTRRARIIWGGAAIAVIVIVALVAVDLARPRPAPAASGIVTTFQPGEFQAVPDTCTAVTTATLGQYLPGKRHRIAPQSLDGRTQSMCGWTLDAPPLYRVLEVTAEAYTPSGLASGDGSATFAAQDAYAQAMQQKVSPPKSTHLPKALITTVAGLGGPAFAALQETTAGGDTTDLLTVVVRDRNVLVTVVVNGLDHAKRGGYGPVSVPQLRAGAVAAARDILAKVN